MDYANAKFLIYNCWEKDEPHKIAGSLLLDGAFTEQEAGEKINLYKARHDDFESKFPSTYKYRTRFIYITNQPEWWIRNRTNVSSPQGEATHHPLETQKQDEV
jgi:hypothetical protein